MDDNFRRFLSVGDLSGIFLNAKKTDVISILKNPDDILKNGDLELYKYKDLEITFQHDRAVIINIELMDSVVDLPSAMGINRLFSGLTIEEITTDLDSEDIGWHICTESSYDQNLVLVTESGALIFYELPSVGLGKVQLSGLIPRCYRYDETAHLSVPRHPKR